MVPGGDPPQTPERDRSLESWDSRPSVHNCDVEGASVLFQPTLHAPAGTTVRIRPNLVVMHAPACTVWSRGALGI
jgi:hypothetical protein